MTLYEELTEAGVPMDNHGEDLAFRKTNESMAILARHDDHRSYIFFHGEYNCPWITAVYKP